MSQNDDLIVRVDEYSDVPKRPGMSSNKKIVFESQTGRKQMCLTFWRAIRKLQSQLSPEKYAEHWKHPFPFEQVESLTRLIKGKA
jgi:hypothetical protein